MEVKASYSIIKDTLKLQEQLAIDTQRAKDEVLRLKNERLDLDREWELFENDVSKFEGTVNKASGIKPEASSSSSSLVEEEASTDNESMGKGGQKIFSRETRKRINKFFNLDKEMRKKKDDLTLGELAEIVDMGTNLEKEVKGILENAAVDPSVVINYSGLLDPEKPYPKRSPRGSQPNAINQASTSRRPHWIQRFDELPDFDMEGRYSPSLRYELCLRIHKEFSEKEIERLKREDKSGKGIAIFGESYKSMIARLPPLGIRNFSELPDYDMKGSYSPELRWELFHRIQQDFSTKAIKKMRLEDESGKGKAIYGEWMEEGKCSAGSEVNGEEWESKELTELFNEKYADDEGRTMDKRQAFQHLAKQLKEKRSGKGKGKDFMREAETINDTTPIVGTLEHEKKDNGNFGSWKPNATEMNELIEAGLIPEKGKAKEKGKWKGKEKTPFFPRDDFDKEKEKENEVAKRVEFLVGQVLAEQEIDKARMEEWWEIERERDLGEIRRLRDMVEELRVLVLKGGEKGMEKEGMGIEGGGCGGAIGGGVCGGVSKMGDEMKVEDEDEMRDCDKPDCGCCQGGSANGGRGGRRGGKAGNVANMRGRDVGSGSDDGEREEDNEGELGNGNGNGNGKGFWDWVGGGILWRQD